MTSEKLAYRKREAAQALGVSVDTIERAIRRRELRALKIGSAVCITAAELARFLSEREEARE